MRPYKKSRLMADDVSHQFYRNGPNDGLIKLEKEAAALISKPPVGQIDMSGSAAEQRFN